MAGRGQSPREARRLRVPCNRSAVSKAAVAAAAAHKPTDRHVKCSGGPPLHVISPLKKTPSRHPVTVGISARNVPRPSLGHRVVLAVDQSPGEAVSSPGGATGTMRPLLLNSKPSNSADFFTKVKGPSSAAKNRGRTGAFLVLTGRHPRISGLRWRPGRRPVPGINSFVQLRDVHAGLALGNSSVVHLHLGGLALNQDALHGFAARGNAHPLRD